MKLSTTNIKCAMRKVVISTKTNIIGSRNMLPLTKRTLFAHSALQVNPEKDEEFP